jgi:multimeric flavodoxin WrbA
LVRIVGISGSPVSNGNTEAFLEKILYFIENTKEVRTTFICLSKKEVQGCRHCNWCVKNQTESKYCAISDDMEEIYPEVALADGILLASPVHAGRLSGLMANALDRMRVFKYGRIHKNKLQDKVGGAIAVAFKRDGGLETTLLSLNSFFNTHDMIMIGWGATGLTSLDGKGTVKKGQPHQILEDEYGMKSAQELAQRMVRLCRILRRNKE